MEVDKLLVVAHPDDEVLWGGLNMISQPGWFVVCSTHLNDPVRSSEFFKTMSFCNVSRYIMFDVKDEYTDKDERADELYNGSLFEGALKKLAKHNWKLVLTHNDEGEYGHAHHKKVHRMVKKLFNSPKFFKVGPRLPDREVEDKRDTLLYYRKTQTICKALFDRKGQTLRALEREHFFSETLYVTPKREIPKIVHQIWFGKPLEKNTVRYNLMKNLNSVALANGWNYRMWTNEDLSPEAFPLTWEFMQLAIKKGLEHEQSRFAQVADLARLELLHRFGGVYMDSLFEIGKPFLDYIYSKRSHEIILANEDPCKLKCVGANGEKYMSNGFFACVPGCINLKRLLNYDILENIDFDSVYINRTTGPYFFRTGMIARDDVHVIPTTKIYPFMVNDSAYRDGQINQCIVDEKVLRDCLTKKYPKSLAVYQSGFGGSWSW